MEASQHTVASSHSAEGACVLRLHVWVVVCVCECSRGRSLSTYFYCDCTQTEDEQPSPKQQQPQTASAAAAASAVDLEAGTGTGSNGGGGQKGGLGRGMSLRDLVTAGKHGSKKNKVRGCWIVFGLCVAWRPEHHDDDPSRGRSDGLLSLATITDHRHPQNTTAGEPAGGAAVARDRAHAHQGLAARRGRQRHRGACLALVGEWVMDV